MTYPPVTTATTGLLLVMQMTLAFTVSGNRGKATTWVGDGGSAGLLSTARRHANLAENAGIFVIGFTLMELSHFRPRRLMTRCAGFVAARLLHAVGLSQQDTKNAPRLPGGMGNFPIGFARAVALVWVGWVGAEGVMP